MAVKHIIPLSVAILIVLGVVIVPTLALLPTDQKAPDFQLNDLSGKAYSLSSYRGKVVVIDFFGAHCPHCKEDVTTNLIPFYYEHYKNDAKVQFLSVEVNGADAATIESAFLDGVSVPWPVLTGGGSLAKSYDFSTVPTLYVIDPAGKVALTMQDSTNTQTLKATIDKLETPLVSPTPSHATNSSTLSDAKVNTNTTSSVNAPNATSTPSPTLSPTPSPPPEKEHSNSTQPVTPTEFTITAAPVTPSIQEQPSNVSVPHANSSSSGATNTVQPETQAAQPSALTSANNTSSNASTISPVSTTEGLATTSMVITAAPLDSLSSNSKTGQVTVASPTPVLAETTSETVQHVDALTGQTSNGASLPPQPVLELSILGIGLPAIVVGVAFLMMRKF